MQFFQDMISSLMRRSARFMAAGDKDQLAVEDHPMAAVSAVMGATGRLSALVHAEQLHKLLAALDDAALAEVLNNILQAHNIDGGALATAAQAYDATPSPAGLQAITALGEPGWVELFRRLSATPDGTAALVKFRERLLQLSRANPDLKRLDVSLMALMQQWFNPGFLVLQPVDWSTPANILEKIIAYEAVHEIQSWDALRARLAPDDRRCFAFFHPTMPEEPLIFVEVALTNIVPDNIETVLDIDRQAGAADAATTAVFYSISNCQAGLAGISFGNFLIKRVAQELRQELDELQTFVTLSPVPGLMRWLGQTDAPLAAAIDMAGTAPDEALHQRFMSAAFTYLTVSDREDGLPNDPVSRFHIGNGAILHQLNFAGDPSAKGQAQSAGLMVNYLYDLTNVEQNHEAFAATKTVPLSPQLAAFEKELSS